MFQLMSDRDGRTYACLPVDQFYLVGGTPMHGEPQGVGTPAQAAFVSREPPARVVIACFIRD